MSYLLTGELKKLRWDALEILSGNKKMEENILNCLVLEIEAGSKSILEYLGGMFSEKVADMQTPCGALALQACYFLLLVILRNLGYSCTAVKCQRISEYSDVLSLVCI